MFQSKYLKKQARYVKAVTGFVLKGLPHEQRFFLVTKSESYQDVNRLAAIVAFLILTDAKDAAQHFPPFLIFYYIIPH